MDAKGLKERITSGLIVWALVTIFIQPVLSLAWRMITFVGGLAHQGYVDRIYREAALSDTNPYARLTLLLVLLVILLGGLFWAVFELRKLEPYPHTFVRVVTLLAEIMVTITVLIIIGRVSILEATSEITASFTQRLTVLAPSVTDAEYKTLKAQWTSMQRKAEYDALVTAMDTRAAQLGIKLPLVRKP